MYQSFDVLIKSSTPMGHIDKVPASTHFQAQYIILTSLIEQQRGIPQYGSFHISVVFLVVAALWLLNSVGTKDSTTYHAMCAPVDS